MKSSEKGRMTPSWEDSSWAYNSDFLHVANRFHICTHRPLQIDKEANLLALHFNGRAISVILLQGDETSSSSYALQDPQMMLCPWLGDYQYPTSWQHTRE